MKKTKVAILMAGLMIVTISGTCFSVSAACAGKQEANFISNPTNNGGTITGTITDKDGGLLSGVLVSAVRAGYVYATTTDNGYYVMSDVTPGQYVVTAIKSGYGIAFAYGVWVSAGQTTTVDLSLSGPIIDSYSEPSNIVKNPSGGGNLVLS
jgi:hypothetical protein